MNDQKSEWKSEQHQYDIDIMLVFNRLRNLVSDSTLIRDLGNKDSFINKLKEEITYYCEERGYDFDYLLQNQGVIIRNDDRFYIRALALQLICLDMFKIRLFLNYHKNNYKDRVEFVGLIEFRVCQTINNISPFLDTEVRLGGIAKWIEDNRKANSKGTPIKGIPTFESLFRDDAFPGKVMAILRTHVLNDDDSWRGFTTFQTEIIAVIKVLEDKRYIYKWPMTVTGSLFREKFKLNLSDRALRSKTKVYNESIQEYTRIIPDLK